MVSEPSNPYQHWQKKFSVARVKLALFAPPLDLAFEAIATLAVTRSSFSPFFNGSEALVFVLVISSITLAAFGLYKPLTVGGSSEYPRMFHAVNFIVVFTVLWNVARGDSLTGDGLVGFYFGLLFALFLSRFILRRIRFFLLKNAKYRQRVLILGSESDATYFVERVRDSQASGKEIIGFIDEHLAPGELIEGIPVLGPLAQLEELVHEHGIEAIVIADPGFLRRGLEGEQRILEILKDVEIQISTGTSELLNSSVEVIDDDLLPLILVKKRRADGLHLLLKVLIDYVLATFFVVLLSPILIVLALLVKLTSSGPIIHKRKVVGKNREEFYFYKFRTMHVNGDAMLTPEQRAEWLKEFKIENDPRITKVGVWMRKLSLDELPQFFNVLRGEMSMVGPRAITMPELEKFGRFQHLRLMVKPGITGLWQVSGRSNLKYEDRIRLDIDYVRNYTIWLDLEIMFRTIPAVLFSRGAH